MNLTDDPGTTHLDEAGHANRRHAVLVAVVTMISTVVIVMASLMAADEVSRVVGRWGIDGTPSTDTVPLWVLTTVLALEAAGVGILLGLIGRRTASGSAQRVVGGLAVGIPAATAVLHIGIVQANAASAAPRFPGDAGVIALSVLVVGSLVGAWVVEVVEQRATVLEAEVLDVAPGEAVVWTGRAVAPGWLWAIMVGAAVLVGVLTWPIQPVATVVLIGWMLVTATIFVARVSVGPAGLSVRMGPFGLVRMQVPLSRVTAVDAIEVDPLAMGGWGYRMLPGLRGLVYDAGPGIRVEQRDGPTTVVTVPGAAQAAGVLRAHLAARAGAREA